MAKLHVTFGAMNSSKTGTMIMNAYNYREVGKNAVILKPSIDTRDGIEAVVKARAGQQSICTLFAPDQDIFKLVAKMNGAEDYQLDWLDENLSPLVNEETVEIIEQVREQFFAVATDYRVGLHAKTVDQADQIFRHLREQELKVPAKKEYQYTRHQALELFGSQMPSQIDCVLIDEMQFMTVTQAKQVLDIVDYLGIPVLVYGLRNDFKGNMFPATQILMAEAEEIRETRGICWCGSKATHVLRIGEDGTVDTDGPQVKVGGNDTYVSVCRYHHRAGQYRNPG